MRFEDGRLLLLSLALLPGCVGRAQGSDDDDDNNGSGGESQRELGDGCKAAAGSYMSCYEGEYEDYETGEGYDLEEYCEESLRYVSMQYGEECARAQDDLFACIAELDCEALGEEDPFAACASALENGHERCPALFPTCDCSQWGSSDGSCGLDCWQCMDGTTRAMTCQGDPGGSGTSTCTCVVDEVETSTFEATDACSDPRALAIENCGLPE